MSEEWRTEMESSWTADVLLPTARALEYKYFIKENHIKTVMWETMIGSRTLCPGTINVAEGKPCEQSSTYEAMNPPVPGRRVASIANNGNTNGYNEWLCCHTLKERQPYWQVDLGTALSVSEIVLWNRADLHASRLAPFFLLVSSEPFGDATLDEARVIVADQDTTSAFAERADEVYFCTGARLSHRGIYFRMPHNMKARYVRVQLAGDNFLHFAELQVLHRVDMRKPELPIEPNAEGTPCLMHNRMVFTPVYANSADGDDGGGDSDGDDGDDDGADGDGDAVVVPAPLPGAHHVVDDGVFGLDSRDDPLHEQDTLQVDDGWVTPATGSELRIVLGTVRDVDPITLAVPQPVRCKMSVVEELGANWRGGANGSQFVMAPAFADNAEFDLDGEPLNIDRLPPGSPVRNSLTSVASAGDLGGEASPAKGQHSRGASFASRRDPRPVSSNMRLQKTSSAPVLADLDDHDDKALGGGAKDAKDAPPPRKASFFNTLLERSQPDGGAGGAGRMDNFLPAWLEGEGDGSSESHSGGMGFFEKLGAFFGNRDGAGPGPDTRRPTAIRWPRRPTTPEQQQQAAAPGASHTKSRAVGQKSYVQDLLSHRDRTMSHTLSSDRLDRLLVERPEAAASQTASFDGGDDGNGGGAGDDSPGGSPDENEVFAALQHVTALRPLPLDVLRRVMSAMLEEGRNEYEDGAEILWQGSPREHFHILVAGEVVVTALSLGAGFGAGLDAAASASNRVEVKRFYRMQHFGESAIVSGGTRTATCHAVGHCVTLRMSRRQLIHIIGNENYARCKEHMAKLHQALPVNAMRFGVGETPRDRPSGATNNGNGDQALSRRGTAWRTGDVQVFSVNLDGLQHVKSRIQIEVYADEGPDGGDVDGGARESTSSGGSKASNGSDNGNGRLLGVAYLTPSLFTASRGAINAPIIAHQPTRAGNPIIGELHCTYLVVNPFVHPLNNISTVWRRVWESRPALDVGHRGLGKSFSPNAGYRGVGIKENTLLSFIVSSRMGVDCIEFDVQLTKDRVPVIYHDFSLEVGLVEELSAKEEPFTVGIHDLTLRQFQRCQLDPVPMHNVMLKRLIKKHWKEIMNIARKRRNSFDDGAAKPKTPKLAALLDQMPTLQSLFYSVPEHLAFNIEVKYPIEECDLELLPLAHFELNNYIDTILNAVFTYAGNRRIFFSCFDPDVCIMLRAKQPRYPVFFLTCSGVDLEYSDTRCLSLKAATMFCKSERLQGMVAQSHPLIADPSIIQAVKSEGLLLFTWGEMNTDADNCRLQKQWGADAVISDNVADITRKSGKTRNVYQDQDDEKEEAEEENRERQRPSRQTGLKEERK